jgi:DNA-binding CsgD family transcriptional regulator
MSTTATTHPQLELARQFIEKTGKNLFLTGKAGTGKTTFLRNLQTTSPKRMVVVAPTGVAAINAGGVTIHSFFQLPFGPQIPNHYLPKEQQHGENTFRFGREKLNIIRSLDLLVIDEISMVRADLLDAIDGVLRRYRYRSKPFGGVQVLMIGDLQQLSPVVKDNEWQLLQAYYKGPFFFQSKVLEQCPAETIELKHIFRQTEETFINVLNEIRENKISQTTIDILQSRYIPNFEAPKGYITLTSHNRQADLINQKKLKELSSSPVTFEATIEDNFPEMIYPNDARLVLKKGAQVMFIKNDASRDKLFFNGKIGMVESIQKESVTVRCDDLDDPIVVTPAEWINYKYTLNQSTNQIEETPVGKFIQIPLKTAWAITIHKSQGLTFERAIIDSNAAFAHGQVYVALSRCRSLQGLVLASPVNPNSIISSQEVNSFIHEAEINPPTKEKIKSFQLEYERELIIELFNFERFRQLLGQLKMEIDKNKTSVLGAGCTQLAQLLPAMDEKIIDVAQSFHQQLLRLLNENRPAEQHRHLQERIQKGCAYFMAQFKELLPLKNLELEFEIESDNKEIRKTITKLLDYIDKSYRTHRDTLTICQKGFSTGQYLAAKSESNIDRAVAKTRSTSTSTFTASTRPDLYSILRQWRDARADELNVAVYMIVSTKTLVALADKMPSSFKELVTIKGLGKRKVEQFGKALLELIQTYRIDHNMAPEDLDFTQAPEKKKEIKRPTAEITLDLFKMGLSPAEIAQKRTLAVSTIESHLAQCIEKGDLAIEKVLDTEKIKSATRLLEGHTINSLTEAKEIVGNAFSFGELKMILATMKHD